LSVQPLTTSPSPAEAAPTAATTTEPVAARPRRWPVHLVVAAVYVGLGLLVMGHFLGDPNGRVSSHLANDNTWFQWLLSHGAYSVRHLENPFFSLRQNYPIGVNMMANTSVLGVTLPLAPVTMLLGARVTYLVWMVGACAGTAFSAYWVLQRYVVRSRAAAFAGGAFAGFAPGVIHHANGQPNFVSNFALPLIVAQVLRLGIDRRWLRDGIILGLLVTYQVFINEELLVVTASACVIAVLAYAALRPRVARERFKSFLLAAAVTAVTAGVLCAYPLWFQFNGPGTFTSLPLYHSWGEDPVTYLTFARDTLVGDPIVEKTMGHPEQNSWFGWPLTTVVVASILLLWRRSVAVRVAAIVAVVCGIMALGPKVRFNGSYPGVRGPWAFIPDDLPVLGLLTPSRITFAVIGAFALIIALAWDAVARVRDRETKTGRFAAVVAMVAIAAALIPLIPKPLPAQNDPRPPVFLTSGQWRQYVPAGRTLVPVPLPNKFAGRETLSWSAWEEHEFPVPEGYFLGPNKLGYGQAGTAEISMLTKLVNLARKRGSVPKVTPELQAKVRNDIRGWDGSVVIMRAVPENAVFKSLVDQLIGPSEQRLDVWLWRV
jgi:hypothetical protein